MPSSKSAGGYRLCDDDAVARLRFVKQARDCGFTLAEIQQLLVLRNQGAACCGDIRQRAIEKKLQLEARIRALSAMSKALDHLISDRANETHPVAAARCWPLLTIRCHRIEGLNPDSWDCEVSALEPQERLAEGVQTFEVLHLSAPSLDPTGIWVLAKR